MVHGRARVWSDIPFFRSAARLASEGKGGAGRRPRQPGKRSRTGKRQRHMMSSTRSRAIIILLFESLLTCLCGAAAIWLRFGAESTAMFKSFNIWLKVGLLMLVVQGAFYIF